MALAHSFCALTVHPHTHRPCLKNQKGKASVHPHVVLLLIPASCTFAHLSFHRPSHFA
ncbi:MAG: hypothetical protein BYD32DRAFT_407519 [Podila humilis]|nr:MAG: hypothetical protein BYD32DRAFT_407519 [Podila humilis]